MFNNINSQLKLNTLAGFEHIKKTWDKKLQCWSARLLPGEYYVTNDDECIATVLGSCISVCIFDPSIKLGGMNHFMLPAHNEHSSNSWGDPTSSSTRYGNFAMEYLINSIIKQGGRKKSFEAKIFGGGQVLANMSDIGQRNIIFAFDYLRKENINVIASDVGDIYPRKVVFFPKTGKVKMKHLAADKNVNIEKEERAYIKSMQTKKASPDDNIELF
ncbi:MAG: chemoreceptor glutamine deamidase CheD [Saccharospirillaceae bacterium]|nr:chemoreceptor glutamine deamidase CheD [Pseudomonadales bacterium]NRB80840.1 chemoreceptor glutamine deamidase CheD [Saccharospirillaceae bacterium]